jgi:Putative transposase
LEIADIFREHGPAWRRANAGHVSLSQLKVMSIARQAIAQQSAERGRLKPAARKRSAGMWRPAPSVTISTSPTIPARTGTARSALLSHMQACVAGQRGPAARDWMAARAEDLLPVEYFHVVFTLPAEIARIAYWNKRAVYGLLFRASAETVMTIAADPKRLGARIGMTSVLHTWGSALTHHPHVHMIVPGGGLSPDGTRWVACKPGFFLHVRVLSRLFRRLFIEGLLALHRAGDLAFFGDLASLADLDAFTTWLAPLRKSEGWFMPNHPSAARKRCSHISAVTRTGSRSRTAV